MNFIQYTKKLNQKINLDLVRCFTIVNGDLLLEFDSVERMRIPLASVSDELYNALGIQYDVEQFTYEDPIEGVVTIPDRYSQTEDKEDFQTWLHRLGLLRLYRDAETVLRKHGYVFTTARMSYPDESPDVVLFKVPTDKRGKECMDELMALEQGDWGDITDKTDRFLLTFTYSDDKTEE